MNRDLIEEIITNPYETRKIKYEENGLFFESHYKFKEVSNLIEGEIRCSNNPSMRCFGSVDVTISPNCLKNEHRASFGNLLVNSEVQNKGIGKTLMLNALDDIKSFKEYFGVDSDVQVSGWLSQADNGKNWSISVPLYEKVGKMASIKTFFIIRDTKKEVATAEEFFKNVGSSDGTIVYYT